MLLRLPAAFAALLSLATIVVATPADVGRLYSRAPGRKCGTNHDNIAQKEDHFASLLAAKAAAPSDSSLDPIPTSTILGSTLTESPILEPTPTGSLSLGPTPSPIPNPNPSNFTISVYFHVIYSSTNITGGYVPDSQIQDQISVLNEDYTGSGLSFKLASTTRTLNADWFDNVGPDTTLQTDMKESLHTGDASALNLYTVSFDNPDATGLLGYATFPADYASNPKDDGVVFLYSSLPGGSTIGFDLGRTATHEIGHWVGLYHPFQGGCSDPGDYVDDTPPEAIPASGCPVGSDTCPGGGVDPIQNYMDYSDDSCMDNFTPGQIARLQAQIATYRGINL